MDGLTALSIGIEPRCLCSEEEIPMILYEIVTPQDWGGNFHQHRYQCPECKNKICLRVSQ